MLLGNYFLVTNATLLTADHKLNDCKQLIELTLFDLDNPSSDKHYLAVC